MQSDTKGIDPRGDAALLAAIKSAKPVPTTKAQADELADTDTDDEREPYADWKANNDEARANGN